MRRCGFTLLILASALSLVGCDFKVPLCTTPDTAIDPALLGVWECAEQGGKVDRLLVLPMGAREYLVSYPAGGEHAMFARACGVTLDQQPLVQLNWLGNAEGARPDDSRTFQYAGYVVTGGVLRVRMLNAEVLNREAATRRELIRSFRAHRADESCFKEEMVFRKVPSRDQ